VEPFRSVYGTHLGNRWYVVNGTLYLTASYNFFVNRLSR